ncbi:hypothetical protein T10_748 [Trichinella papuae]|uniref:Uncharacterized protein n=1 Tax=Trichinella papuae TaxID=268474 RepID=A0A0V1LXA2_9BILA|nr:hypothetical protein T10_748 [Trichinella papuae]
MIPVPCFILIASVYELQHQPTVEYEQLVVSTDDSIKILILIFHSQ